MTETPSAAHLAEQIERLDRRAGAAAELCTEALLLGADAIALWHARRYAERDALRVEYRQQRRDLARLAATA